MIIEVKNAPQQRIVLSIVDRTQNIGITQDVILVPDYGAIPEYNGAYEVIPSAHLTQTLKTAKKVMGRDVIIHKIPYFETSNNSGGNTVFIGKEVETDG